MGFDNRAEVPEIVIQSGHFWQKQADEPAFQQECSGGSPRL